MTSPRRRPYVTQADIANEAGVSRPLVSLVLRNSPKVSQDKRDRVLQAAERLGYIGSGIATSLAGNRSNLLVGYLAQDLRNELFTEIFASMRSVLDPLGHRLIVMEGSSDPDIEDASLRDLVSFRPNAIVLAGYAGSTSALRAASSSLPFISVTRQIQNDNVHSVLNDDYAGAVLATQHLIDQGHTKITHLQIPEDIPYEQRAVAYTTVMIENGLKPHVVTGGLTVASGHEATLSLFEAHRPTALFCGTDALALGAFDALRQLDLRVPEDVALIGYDNIDATRRLDISSIDQQAKQQGIIAAKMLIDAVVDSQEAPSSTVLQPQLIQRSSTGPQLAA